MFRVSRILRPEKPQEFSGFWPFSTRKGSSFKFSNPFSSSPINRFFIGFRRLWQGGDILIL